MLNYAFAKFVLKYVVEADWRLYNDIAVKCSYYSMVFCIGFHALFGVVIVVGAGIYIWSNMLILSLKHDCWNIDCQANILWQGCCIWNACYHSDHHHMTLTISLFNIKCRKYLSEWVMQDLYSIKLNKFKTVFNVVKSYITWSWYNATVEFNWFNWCINWHKIYVLITKILYIYIHTVILFCVILPTQLAVPVFCNWFHWT